MALAALLNRSCGSLRAISIIPPRGVGTEAEPIRPEADSARFNTGFAGAIVVRNVAIALGQPIGPAFALAWIQYKNAVVREKAA